VTVSSAARIGLGSAADSRIATGVAVLDHLLAEFAEAGHFSLQLELAPTDPETEVGQAGAALGSALDPLLGVAGVAGRGFGIAPADEALAMVVVEASGRPLVASNADLTSTRAGGLRSDLAATFLEELATAAGLTVHVRLIEGENSQHVLSAIFKALGLALARACAPA
jgi:imidazoleglycerol-phosphate dehydratase